MITEPLSTLRKNKVEILTEVLCLPSDQLPGGVTRGRKNELWKGLGARLRLMRLRSNRTPAAICRDAKVGSPTVNRVEQLENIPMIDTVERLAAALGIPAGWLAFGPDGYEAFVKKRPRRPLPPDAPEPSPQASTFTARFEGCASRVTEARCASGLSMRTLSQSAGISVQTWSKVEGGTTIPKVDSLERMAVALDVPPAWLAYGDDEGDTAA